MPHRPDQSNARRKPRRVLLISCAFPPTGGTEGLRPAGFARYLPRFGWHPVVWTIDDMPGQPRDTDLRASLPPQVTVHAQPVQSSHTMRRSLRGLMSPGANGLASAGALSGNFAMASGRRAAAIDWRLEAWLTATGLPDEFITWARASLRPLLSLIRSERISALYSTFGPASNHWLGLELKRRTGLPWIAEFRNLWTDHPNYQENSIRRRSAHRRLEQDVLETADVVIGVTKSQTALLRRHVAAEGRGTRFHTITNGFDPADFSHDAVETAAAPNATKRDKRPFVLVVINQDDGRDTLPVLIQALKDSSSQLDRPGAKNGKKLRGGVRLRIVGPTDHAALEQLQAAGIPCEHVEDASHGQVLAALQSADALLWMESTKARNAAAIPGRLFECLATGRPVLLAGSQEGACAEVVRHCAAGATVGYDPKEIAGELRRLLEQWASGGQLHGCDPKSLSAYSLDTLTKRLARLLDQSVTTMERETLLTAAGAPD